MLESFPLFPESASTFAREMDLLFGYLVAVTIFFSGDDVVLFVVHYR